MAWRCGAKKNDGKKCKCAVAKKGSRCSHHKRKRASNPKKKTRVAKRKRVRCRPSRAKKCASLTACGKRCKQYAAGTSKYCRVHKGKPLKSRKVYRKNPITPLNNLQDRWSLPRLPKGTIG